MKKAVMKGILTAFSCFLLIGCQKDEYPDITQLKNGDIIFQTSTSGQSQAIQLATKSQYSHCGIVYQDPDNGQYYVFEAIQPVKRTHILKWIARGEDNHFVVKRLKNADEILTTEVLEEMKSIGKTMNGKDYDLYFEWSDDEIYCSELVWKLYERTTGLELGKLQKLKEFDLSHPTVQKKMKERYGNDIPYNEKVISPAAIFESDLLYTVMSE